MSWLQLKELDREGLIHIESQTVTHPEDLRKLDDRKLAWEMTEPKRVLEANLGRPIQFVAYPNGKYDARVARAAKAAGYRMAFTEELAPAETASSKFLVPRYVHTKWKRALSDVGG